MRSLERSEKRQSLLKRAEQAQFNDFSSYSKMVGPAYFAWMRDRQMLTDLIHELAQELKNVPQR